MKARKKKYDVYQHFFVIRIPYLIVGLSTIMGVFILLALSTFSEYDASSFYTALDQKPLQNVAGKIGSLFASYAFYYMGYSAYLLGLFCIFVAFCYAQSTSLKQRWDQLVGWFLVYIVAIPLCAIVQYSPASYYIPGGVWGAYVSSYCIQAVGKPLVWLALSIMMTAGLILISRLSFSQLRFAIAIIVRALEYSCVSIVLPLCNTVFQCISVSLSGIKNLLLFIYTRFSGKVIQAQELNLYEFEREHALQQQECMQSSEEHSLNQQSSEFTYVEPISVVQADVQKATPIKKSFFKLPSESLLHFVVQKKPSHEEFHSDSLSTILEQKLVRFGVKGKVVAVKQGPVVTLFEYQPDADTKVSKIVSLEDDLAMALEALSVRIIAPIPGTSRVGIEVANKERTSVFMNEIIRSSIFKKHSGALPFVLGKDTVGNNVVADLADMPHLLVAGSTGSGKSVALNALLISLLCKRSPEEMRLVIIDPKRLEFTSYHDIPHLLFPVITQPAQAAPVLSWLVRTMEERYEKMAQLNVRNIGEYKRMCKQKDIEDTMPYIVVMIDELADLMIIARKEIEESIARLAQMARASGIHLILATQRPSVDVLTGVIKVNFPSRIAFRVSSKIDSRTIIDTMGAEKLLGKGDMLFMDAHSAGIKRLHGAYVTDDEITSIVSFIKTQQKPEYIDLQSIIAQHIRADSQELDDPLLQDIIRSLDHIDELSISSLQRKFSIGYNRSARIVENLEHMGYIMPADGSKMRKVIK